MKLSSYRFTTLLPLAAGLILAVAFGVAWLVINNTQQRAIRQALEETTQPLVSTTARLLFNPVYKLESSQIDDILSRFASGSGIIYAGVRDREGRILGESTQGWTPENTESLARAEQALGLGQVVQQTTRRQLAVTSPIAVGAEQIGTVEYVFDLASVQAGLQNTQQTISVTILITLLSCVLVIFFLARLFAAPLGELASAAESIGQGYLSAPVEVQGTQEIQVLAETLDRMKEQVRQSMDSQEQRVADRTRALRASGEVSRRISTILDQGQLAREAVDQLQLTFHYYHAQVYLYDSSSEYLIMVGGAGEAGQELLRRGHKLPRGKGLVGRAALTNSVVLVPDVSKDSSWLPNPILPETRSEAAVPIALGEQVLGVLDVQQNTPGALGSDDVDMLQTIANQVAIALQNARAYERTRRQVERAVMVNTIGQKIQETSSVDEALRVAVRELGRAVGAPETCVRLGGQSTVQ